MPISRIAASTSHRRAFQTRVLEVFYEENINQVVDASRTLASIAAALEGIGSDDPEWINLNNTLSEARDALWRFRDALQYSS